MHRMLGYARVSTSDQTVRSQVDALQRAGCERIWTDTASGARADRPALEELLTDVRSGDTLMVTRLDRLDRLGRSLPRLPDLVEQMASQNVGLRSLAEQIDTTSATGRLIIHVFASLAEFERGINHKRTWPIWPRRNHAVGRAAARKPSPATDSTTHAGWLNPGCPFPTLPTCSLSADRPYTEPSMNRKVRPR